MKSNKSKNSPWAGSAEELINTYFSVKWYGRTAEEAFELGKEMAANIHLHRAMEILPISFDQFAKYALSPEVKPDSIRNI